MTAVVDMTGLSRGKAAGVGFVRRQTGARAKHGLVLLHGIGSNAQSFEPLLSALPPFFDVIAWNAPGYADSDALTVAAPTPQDYAAALAKLLDALDLPRIVLAGHSLGALFACRFAAQYPQRVSALALMSPALGYRVAAGAPLPENVQARIDEIEALGPAGFAAKRASRLVDDAENNPQLVASVQRAMGAVNVGGYIQAVRALGAGDLMADAASIAAPALVMVGTGDVITPPANARSAHDAFRNPAGYHEIAAAGHALPQQAPRAVADILTQFVEQHANV